MTHPGRLSPKEAVKAVMWILMCSNDLLFVSGIFFAASTHVRVMVSSSSGITCRSDHANEDDDGADGVSE